MSQVPHSRAKAGEEMLSSIEYTFKTFWCAGSLTGSMMGQRKDEREETTHTAQGSPSKAR